MRTTLLLILLFFIPFLNSTYSQSLDFNLKNLNNISVEVMDEQGLLSNKINQKLITEIKLKLMSSGMKVTSSDESDARMFLIVNVIMSKFAEHRILVQLNIYEKVKTPRIDDIYTGAITYSVYSFFTDKFIEQAVYDKVMDLMIINFIEIYLGQK